VTGVICPDLGHDAQVAGTQNDLLIPAICLPWCWDHRGARQRFPDHQTQCTTVRRNAWNAGAIRGAQLAYTKGVPSGQVPQALTVLKPEYWTAANFIRNMGSLQSRHWICFDHDALWPRVYGCGHEPGSGEVVRNKRGSNIDLDLMSVQLMAVSAGIVLSSYVGYVDRYLGQA